MELTILIFSILILAVFGVAFLHSNLGVGGGVLYVPLLLSLTALPMKEVVPLSLLFAMATSISATANHHRKGLVDFKLGITLACGAIIGAIIGARFTLIIAGDIVKLMFAVVLIIVAVKMLTEIYRGSKKINENNPSKNKISKEKMLMGSSFSIVTGFLSGSLGIGGGAVNVPLLIYLFKVKARSIIPTAAMGFSTFVFSAGNIDYSLAIILAPVVLIGAFIGSRWGLESLRTPTVKALFAFVLFLAAVKMFFSIL
jgi:uncharacterized membrane protein YfcA